MLGPVGMSRRLGHAAENRPVPWRDSRRMCAAVEMRQVWGLACATMATGASGQVKDWLIWGPWKGCIGMPKAAWRRWARSIRPGRGG